MVSRLVANNWIVVGPRSAQRGNNRPTPLPRAQVVLVLLHFEDETGWNS